MSDERLRKAVANPGDFVVAVEINNMNAPPNVTDSLEDGLSFRSRKREAILKQRRMSLHGDAPVDATQEEPVIPSPRMAVTRPKVRSSSLSRLSSKKDTVAFSGSFITKRRADAAKGSEKPHTPPRPPASKSHESKASPDRASREKQKRRLGFGLRQFSSSPSRVSSAAELSAEPTVRDTHSIQEDMSASEINSVPEDVVPPPQMSDTRRSDDAQEMFRAGSWEAKSDVSFPNINDMGINGVAEEKKDAAESTGGHQSILQDLADVDAAVKLKQLQSPRESSQGRDEQLVSLSSGNPVGASQSSSLGASLPPPPPPPGGKKKRHKNKNKAGRLSHTDSTMLSVAEVDEDALSESETSGDDASTARAVSLDDDSQVHSPPNLLQAKSSHSLDAIAPAFSSMVISDQKMAEKVERAISAAAIKLDQRMTTEHHTRTSSLDDGAFVKWHSTESAESSSNLTTISGSVKTEEQPRKWQPRNLHIYPDFHPSPFEAAVYLKPRALGQILDFLGDPVAVCRAKILNRNCRDIVQANEHKLMRDAVRLGGLKMSVRPYFWLWVTIQKWGLPNGDGEGQPKRIDKTQDLTRLERIGRDGKWHGVIDRDVARSFGNLPPHKTGARLRTDSIVRALVTWGKSRFLPRGIRGVHDAPQSNRGSRENDDETPREIVQNWSGVTPVGSFASDADEEYKAKPEVPKPYRMLDVKSDEEMALSGNTLTDEAKDRLQHKLSFILHALASAHSDVGYCQGMDYVVAHLLRILQDTIRWQASTGTLPSIIASAPEPLYGPNLSQMSLKEAYEQVDRTLVVEEVCFRVMDVLMSTYELRHFYWPELRCLKTCCRVFEKLIQIKLPVLAEHFEYHELNVGLFALGWFQTLFLYLPSMPSATVCHIWDIWLVERSFKIFFRVATAILFLSQPILLNHELEGMMSYLNTFPDATLLSPDILIACALQIKVTNRMLMDLEAQVVAEM